METNRKILSIKYVLKFMARGNIRKGGKIAANLIRIEETGMEEKYEFTYILKVCAVKN